MKDNYPETLEFEIDRDALRRYLRVKWFLCWFSLPAFWGVLLGFGSATDHLGHHEYNSLREILTILTTRVGWGLVGAFIVATTLYLLFSHRVAARTAANLRVIVEGAFLRIIQHGFMRSDRKLHFRSIVDYTTLEGPLMRRFGIMALHMTTTGGGNQAFLRIFGVRDCPKVRNQLAEMDALRENG